MPTYSNRGLLLFAIGFAFFFVRFRFGQIFLRQNSGLQPGIEDHLFGFLARQFETGQRPVVADRFAILAFGPSDQVIGCAVCQILDRLDIVLAERNEHGGSHARNGLQFVGKTKTDAFLVMLGLDLNKMLAGTHLKHFRGGLVEAFDRGNLIRLHIGDFLDIGEAFGSQQLTDHLVDIQRHRE